MAPTLPSLTPATKKEKLALTTLRMVAVSRPPPDLPLPSSGRGGSGSEVCCAQGAGLESRCGSSSCCSVWVTAVAMSKVETNCEWALESMGRNFRNWRQNRARGTREEYGYNGLVWC